MELQSCIEQRRSVRKYKTQPVPREQLREIIQAAILAPEKFADIALLRRRRRGKGGIGKMSCRIQPQEFKGCAGAHCVNGRYKTFRFYARRRIRNALKRRLSILRPRNAGNEPLPQSA